MPSFEILPAVPRSVVSEMCRPDSSDTCRFHGTRRRKDGEERTLNGEKDKPSGVCMRGNPILAEQAMKFQRNTREGCTGAPNYQPITGGAA